jgi:prepilin-type N-terminal cleavage/methylation domain-containing protein
MSLKLNQSGFTLVEVAVVLLIVGILLGYTVALIPRQQELKQYRAVDRQMDEVMEAIIGFAQVNGRLPCPAIPNSGGVEDFDNDGSDADLFNGSLPDGCYNYGGFVPVNTLGLNGRLNDDLLLRDPWGNPYRYYVTDVDFNENGLSDFTFPREMRLVGLVDSEPNTPPGDGYIDLDGRYIICESAGTAANRCAGANPVFGRFLDGNGDDDDHHVDDRYGGAPFVLVSMGKNWNEVALAGDELVNGGSILTTAFTPAIPDGPAGMPYLLKDVGNRETIFVRRLDGMADDFDDVVRWVSPSVLFSRMIQADQLP